MQRQSETAMLTIRKLLVVLILRSLYTTMTTIVLPMVDIMMTIQTPVCISLDVQYVQCHQHTSQSFEKLC